VEKKFNGCPPADKNSIVLITDMNKVHLDPFGVNEPKPLRCILNKYNARRFYLPPASPHLNPLESMFTNLKTKLFKKDIHGSHDLYEHMSKCMQDMSQESVEVYFEDTVKCVKSAKGEEPSEEQSAEQSNYSFDNSK
jgi:hypothetical protein